MSKLLTKLGGALAGLLALAALLAPVTASAVFLVPQGGTGITTATTGGVLIGNGSNAFNVTGAGTSGQVLTSNGTGVAPTFQAASGGGSGFSTTSAAYWFTTKTTDQLAEGTTNLYWTNTRFDARLTATTSLPSIITLAHLSLPFSQITGAFAYLFPGNATSTALTFSGGIVTPTVTFDSSRTTMPLIGVSGNTIMGAAQSVVINGESNTSSNKPGGSIVLTPGPGTGTNGGGVVEIMAGNQTGTGYRATPLELIGATSSIGEVFSLSQLTGFVTQSFPNENGIFTLGNGFTPGDCIDALDANTVQDAGSACGSGGGATFGKTFEIDGSNLLTPTTTIGINVANNAGYYIGDSLLAYASTTNRDTAFGLSAGGINLLSGATVASTTAFGYRALNSDGTGKSNTAVGADALLNLVSTSNSTAVGDQAGLFATGANNVIIGAQAGRGTAQYSATGNVLVGAFAGFALTSNTTSSSFNTFLGASAGSAVTSASFNTLIGGNNAGGNNLTTGGSNIAICGDSCGFASNTSNSLDIGNVLYASNLWSGAGLSTAVAANPLVGVGTTSPFANFSIQANTGDTNLTLFAIGSSTASTKTTLFSVNNVGAITTQLGSGFVKSSGAGSALTIDSNTYLTTAVTSAAAGAGIAVSGSTGAVTITNTIGYPFIGNATSTLLTFSGGASIANTLTLSGITGSTQCLHVNTSGVVSGTGSDCGTGAGGVTSLAATYPAIVSGSTGAITISSGLSTTTQNFWSAFNSFTSLFSTNASTTNATTTNLAIVGAAANCNGTNALTTSSTGVVQCTAQPQGTLTGLSVASTNGFGGSSSGGATPTITLTTSVTGLLKGNGTGVTAAAAGTDFEVPLTFSTGLTRTTNTVTVNTSQNIANLTNLSTAGYVKTTGTGGALSVDTNTYLTGNQTVTLSGVVTGSGATAITTAFGSQAAGVLGSPATGNTAVQATSTLYGAVQPGKILGGINGVLGYIATTTDSCSTGITCSFSAGNNAFSIAGGAITNAMLANSTISGVALGSTLFGLTNADGTINFSSTYNGTAAQTASVNLAHANSWTVLQQFTNASSSKLSAGIAYFGTTATTTIDAAGNIVIPSGSTLTNTGVANGCATFASGVLGSTGSVCGSGGGGASPGGAQGAVQYNNSSAFAGANDFFITPGGSISIGSSTPSANTLFSIVASSTGQQFSSLFAVASSSSGTATTTLFSVNPPTATSDLFDALLGNGTNVFAITNTGSTTLGNFGQCNGSNALMTDSSGNIVCGATAGGGGGGAGNVSTSTSETAGFLAYWTSTGATPATLGKVATSTPSLTGTGLAYTGTLGSFVGGTSGTFSIAGLGGSNFAFIGANTIFGNPTGASAAPSFFATSTLFGTPTPGSILAFLGGKWIGAATSTLATISGLLNLATQVTGTLGAGNGGTGATSVSAGFSVVSNVFSQVEHHSFTYATSTAWTGTTTVPLETGYGEKWNSVRCFTDIGTVAVDFYHSTNHLDFIKSASTTNGINSFTTNNTMTSGDNVKVDIGTPASAPGKITCTEADTF